MAAAGSTSGKEHLVREVPGVLIVNGHADLHLVTTDATDQYEGREHEWVARHPAIRGLRIFPIDEPVLAETMLEWLEANVQVMTYEATHFVDFDRIGDAFALQHVLPQVTVQVLCVHGVHGVLHALEPIARDHRGAYLPPCALFNQRKPARNLGSG